MHREFYLNNGKAMINFTTKYCDTAEKVFNSNGFREVLQAYLDKIEKKKSNIYKYIIFIKGENEIDLVESIIKLFKLLMMLNIEEVNKINDQYRRLLEDRDMFVSFIEDFYGFWRKIERYTIVQNNKVIDGLQNVSFIDANNRFTQLILDIYRKVEESVLSYKPKVYRQLPVGGNAGLILNDVRWPYPKEYSCLDNIPFIQSILLDPPFIVYPKKNKRDGMFTECFENPLKDKNINKDHWLCYPAKVGSLLAYIYFHRNYMAHGLSLCNLFELASEEEYKDKKPDIVYVFGIRDDTDEIKTVFYDDKENEILLGYVNNNEKIDYFGYMKKMTLTLHNLIMIKRGYLPVHGAMVNIVNKNNKTANIVIVGDSGAGKSESLEAFRQLSDDYISDMNIIFDDMGVIKVDKSKGILGYGTEIGAFIRLDDLDTGYAFKQIDRSIFMNPDKINARLVIPITVYKEIIKGYPINMFLYANNYEEGDELEFINNVGEAIDIFKIGTRIAKGTTSEKGLVNTYFANPFGPAQRIEDMNILLKTYFNEFFKAGIKVGQLRTRLGLSGREKDGPRKAALSLLQTIKSL